MFNMSTSLAPSNAPLSRMPSYSTAPPDDSDHLRAEQIKNTARQILQPGKLIRGRYRVKKALGSGASAVVAQAYDTVTGYDVAVKLIHDDLTVLDRPASDPSEAGIHARAGSHPNIAAYRDSFRDGEWEYIIAEFCSNGDLFEFLVGDGARVLDNVTIRRMILQLISAIQHLHENNIYHLDVKPENILLDSRANLKLADFGLATSQRFTEKYRVGSESYMAPEQFRKTDGFWSSKADIWALGVCIVNILTCRTLYEKPCESNEAFRSFIHNPRRHLKETCPSLTSGAISLILACLETDVWRRDLALIRELAERTSVYVKEPAVASAAPSGVSKLFQNAPANIPVTPKPAAIYSYPTPQSGLFEESALRSSLSPYPESPFHYGTGINVPGGLPTPPTAADQIWPDGAAASTSWVELDDDIYAQPSFNDLSGMPFTPQSLLSSPIHVNEISSYAEPQMLAPALIDADICPDTGFAFELAPTPAPVEAESTFQTPSKPAPEQPVSSRQPTATAPLKTPVSRLQFTKWTSLGARRHENSVSPATRLPQAAYPSAKPAAVGPTRAADPRKASNPSWRAAQSWRQQAPVSRGPLHTSSRQFNNLQKRRYPTGRTTPKSVYARHGQITPDHGPFSNVSSPCQLRKQYVWPIQNPIFADSCSQQAKPRSRLGIGLQPDRAVL